MSPLFFGTATLAALPADESWLAPAEHERFAKLRVPKRARDFLLGRFTAKHVLARALADVLGAVDVATLSILPRPDGSPEAFHDGRPLSLDVSLSHSTGRAFAVVTLDPEEHVGCDVEHVEPRGPELAQDFFTAAEQRALASRTGAALDVATTLVWSAKESTLKVLREGLRADTRSVEVALLEPVVDATWRPLETRHGGRTYTSAMRLADGFVFTVSTTGTAPTARLVDGDPSTFARALRS